VELTCVTLASVTYQVAPERQGAWQRYQVDFSFVVHLLLPLMQTGAPVGTVKLLRNTESLASLCVSAGLSIKDAEALKGLFPDLAPRALVHALTVASGRQWSTCKYTNWN
jgi:hypothetical protein